MLNRLAFIEETLRSVADSVAKQGSRRSDYTDVKGYLAEADLIAHSTITGAIKTAFLGEPLLSEEDDGVLRDAPDALWIADPLCGTTNYVRGIPLYTHSLCYMSRGEVIASGIYHPGLDEMFLVDPVQATLNGQSVRVSSTERMAEAVVSFNCNQATSGQGRVLGQLQTRLQPPVTRRIRVYESANLEMAWVACGRLDAYVSPDDKIWDLAAGSLLVSVAGGKVRTWSGRFGDLARARGVVATNGFIYRAVNEALKEAVFG